MSKVDSIYDYGIGIKLDWDGNESRTDIDVRNELDLIMTYGHIPVFVSCKNTEIKNDYLYEIATMAKHYGGEYARTMIFSNSSNQPTVKRRAKEMGIMLVDELSQIFFGTFVDILRKMLPPLYNQ